jgi:endoglucanase
VTVYVDAGHPAWQSAAEMARRLALAGIENADGFSLNVSNFVGTEANTSYGADLSTRLGGKHFVIDTGRNGLGPTSDYQWCNPSGRALGVAPGTLTAHRALDAYLWIKPPGESDGTCNGGPSAGSWWPDYALGLAQRS